MTGIIVKSKIKKLVKELDETGSISSVSENIGDALEEEVRALLKKAIERAKKNQRRTLLPRDL